MNKKVNGSHFNWSKDAALYEVNIRQYTGEGTLNAFSEHLLRIKEMGVKILWLMPVFPIGKKNRKGSLGSYYSISDYRSVNPEFGNIDDLKELVKKAHDQGMKVILDWVANHTSWDHVWTVSNPDYYKRKPDGAFVVPQNWDDVVALDYDNRNMRKEMIASMRFWIEECSIDGFRCDMAGLVPVSFWEEARKELDETKSLFWLAEDEDNMILMKFAFDMNYSWRLHHIFNDIAKGRANAENIRSYFLWNNSVFPSSVYRLNFITNHDENSWNGSEYERLGEGTEAFAVLTYILPGAPLIYSGQEAGCDKRLNFFEKDEIYWDDIKNETLYRNLNQLKRENKALWSGRFGAPLLWLGNDMADKVLSVVRPHSNNIVIAVFNLTDEKLSVSIDVKEFPGRYSETFSKEIIDLQKIIRLDLEPWGYKVFVKH